MCQKCSIFSHTPRHQEGRRILQRLDCKSPDYVQSLRGLGPIPRTDWQKCIRRSSCTSTHHWWTQVMPCKQSQTSLDCAAAVAAVPGGVARQYSRRWQWSGWVWVLFIVFSEFFQSWVEYMLAKSEFFQSFFRVCITEISSCRVFLEFFYSFLEFLQSLLEFGDTNQSFLEFRVFLECF